MSICSPGTSTFRCYPLRSFLLVLLAFSFFFPMINISSFLFVRFHFVYIRFISFLYFSFIFTFFILTFVNGLFSYLAFLLFFFLTPSYFFVCTPSYFSFNAMSFILFFGIHLSLVINPAFPLSFPLFLHFHFIFILFLLQSMVPPSSALLFLIFFSFFCPFVISFSFLVYIRPIPSLAASH